jgi:hypothetical protein
MTAHGPNLQRTHEIEQELPQDILPLAFHPWPDRGFRLGRSVCTGALLGAIAGCVSLIANVIGSTFVPPVSGAPQSPLRLIQVFLTFSLGADALELGSGLALGLGCLLYLLTGAFYGMIFESFIEFFLPRATVIVRICLFSVMAIALWAVNFYGILYWLQPLLYGERWIAELIPWWVAALTHLLFGLTMALLQPIRGLLPESI